MPDKTFIGGNIKQYREAADLPLYIVAHAAGISASYLKSIECGEVPVDAYLLPKFADVLGVTVYQLMGIEDEFESIWYSGEKLNERFGVKSVVVDELKHVKEEYREALDAAVNGYPGEFAEEFADLMVTLANVARARGVPLSSMRRIMRQVVAKNAAKTHETHVFSDGKIRRKPVPQE